MTLRETIAGLIGDGMADGLGADVIADQIIAALPVDLNRLRDSPSSGELAQRAAEHLAGQDTQSP